MTAVGLGVLVAVAGTLSTSLGNHLVAKSHQSDAHAQDSTESKTIAAQSSRALFLWGNFLMIVLGTGFHLAAFAWAPQALISPLGGLTIVWTMALGSTRYFGRAVLKRSDYIFTGLTMFGCALLVWAGPRPRAEDGDLTVYDADEADRAMLTPFFRPRFALFFVLSIGIVLVLENFVLALGDAEDRGGFKWPKSTQRAASSAIGGFLGGLSNVFAKGTVEGIKRHHYHHHHATSQSPDELYNAVLAADGAATLFGHRLSSLAIMSCCVLLSGGLALLQILFLNRALASFQAVGVVPIYQVVLLLASTTSGGIAFDEFAGFTWWRWWCFSLGVASACLGVAALSRSTAATSSTRDGKREEPLRRGSPNSA